MNSTESAAATRRPSGKFIHRVSGRHPRWFAILAAGIACLSLVLFLPTAVSAQGPSVESFLSLPPIRGDSKTDNHKAEIEILGFGSGVEVEVALGGGGGASKPQFFEITVSKKIDRASPLLFVNCATGKIFPIATLTMAKVTQSGVTDIFTIVLTNARITRITTNAQAGAVAEEVSLSFEKIRWTVVTPTAKGPPITTTGGFDLKGNVPL